MNDSRFLRVALRGKCMWGIGTLVFQRKSLRKNVRDEVVLRIASVQLRPGKRISGTKLAEELGVSYIPVREALHELVGASILETKSNKGTKARAIDLQELISAFQVCAYIEALAATRTGTGVEHDAEQMCEGSLRTLATARSPPKGRVSDREPAESRELQLVLDPEYL